MVSYLSVCSGIEAASVAWHPLGWRPLAFSETEPFPRAVLQHHYPQVPLHGDFTVLRNQPWIVDADVLVGGTPCQAFSVAGLRHSLADERGNLSLEFVRLADAIDNHRRMAGKDSAIIVWENVPGVLSVKDNAFGCFLAGLAGDVDPYVPPRGKWTNAGVAAGPARTVAWRVLDAQYFGLAQRRRRVFVVASARDGFDPAAVLLEFEGVRRDTPPRREAREIAPTIPSRSTAGGGLGTDFDCDGGVITHSLRAEGFDASEGGPGRGTPLVPVAIREDATPKWQEDLAFTLTQPSPTGGGHPQSVAVAFEPGKLKRLGYGYTVDGTTPTLRANPGDNQLAAAYETGKGDAAPCVATVYSIMPQNSGKDYKARPVDVAQPIMAGGPVGGNQGGDYVQQHMAVRRLTPVECERLQGFPDNYTNIPWRKQPAAPDGPRYKALGNSMAVPCMRWIGKRIANAIA